MRGATVIRNLVVGALLPLSVAGCFKDKSVKLEVAEILERDTTWDICYMKIVATNELDEPIETLVATLTVNDLPVYDGYANSFSTEKGRQKTDRIVIGQSYTEELYFKGECPENAEITSVKIEACATTERDCSKDVTF
ncbi:hypothetical protein ABIE58_003431 [Roseovarius sp. MBR-78]|jgi:hypothetical protein